ncbi:hypothetical protein C8R44DRAFT_794868 [Mycena epipterygia]|nr:hypothetical protein C8R44DRAFT_794868 [Mycena epipterygia]
MSSEEGIDGIFVPSKKRRVQRACDMFRRKKAASGTVTHSSRNTRVLPARLNLAPGSSLRHSQSAP